MSKNAEHELIRLASRNPKVRAKLKEAGVLDDLWKKYKEKFKGSKRPPQSLRDKAKEIEDKQKAKKKEEEAKSESSSSSESESSGSAPKGVEKRERPDISKPSELSDSDLSTAIDSLNKDWGSLAREKEEAIRTYPQDPSKTIKLFNEKLDKLEASLDSLTKEQGKRDEAKAEKAKADQAKAEAEAKAKAEAAAKKKEEEAAAEKKRRDSLTPEEREKEDKEMAKKEEQNQQMMDYFMDQYMGRTKQSYLRADLIRLAYAKPELRNKVLPLLTKQAGEFTEQEWKTHIQKHPNADPKDHTITKGDSKGKSSGKPLSKLELSDRTKKRVKDLVEELTPIIHDPEDEYGDKDFKEEVYDLIKENSPMFSHSNQDIKDAVDALLSEVKKNKPSGKQASLRAKLIRLAYAKPELREKILPLIKQADEDEEAKAGPSKRPGGKFIQFMKEMGDEKVRNPDTGNDVKLKSLKGDRGRKLQKEKFEKWLASQENAEDKKEDKPTGNPKEDLKKEIADLEKKTEKLEQLAGKHQDTVGDMYRIIEEHPTKRWDEMDKREKDFAYKTELTTSEKAKVKGAIDSMAKDLKEEYGKDLEVNLDEIKTRKDLLKFVNRELEPGLDKFKEDYDKAGTDVAVAEDKLKNFGKKASLRAKLIRLAHEKPELRSKSLPLLTKEAKDPSYQDYLDKKKKDGEKPLPKDQWETKVLGKSEKDEKGSEDGGSKSKNFMDPKDYLDAEDASAYVDMDDLGKSVSAIKGFIGGSSKDKQTHAGKLFGFSEKEIEGHFDYKNGDRGPDIKEIPGFQTAYQALNQTMGNLFNSDGTSNEGEMADFATEFNDALGDEDAFLQTMNMSRINSSKVQREALKLVSKAVKEIQKQIANETNIDISDGGYDLKWAKKASKTAGRNMPALSWVIPYAEKAGAREETFVNGGVRVWRWEDEGMNRRTGQPFIKYHLVVASGNKRARRAMVYEYHFKAASRDQKVDRIVANMQAKLDAKAKAREEAMNFQHGYQVGDILYASWGYDQTNVDFYQVTRLVGAKMIEIQRISSKDAGRDRVMPVPNRFVSGERPFKVKVRTNRSVKTRGGVANAYPWDGKPKYETSPYAGH